MSITTKGNPQAFTPVYNEMNFYFDSTNKLEDGFRYVFDLYYAGTSNKIAEFRGAPRPGDGYGIAKIAKYLDPLITRHINPKLLTSAHAVENYIQFDLKVGEEYIEAWEYSDYEFYSNGSSVYNGYVQLRQFTEDSAHEHSFSVGDQINITQDDGGALKPLLSGLHTVVEVVDAWRIIIEIPFEFIGSGATVGGTIGFADGKKTVDRALQKISGTAYNGVLSFLDFRLYDQDEYSPVTAGLNTTRNLLTSLPSGYRVKGDSSILVNIVPRGTASSIRMRFQNDNGDLFQLTPTIATGNYITQVQVGGIVSGLSVISGTAGLVKSNTQYYDFWATNSSNVQISKKYRLLIDRRCTIEDYEILFEDRFGSMIPFQFQLRSEEILNVARQEYKKELGDLSGTAWTYPTTGEGFTTSNVTIKEEVLLRTNFMTREEALFYNEFLSSPTHLIKIGEDYLSCRVKDTNTTTQGEGTRKLIRKDVTVILSNENKVNI